MQKGFFVDTSTSNLSGKDDLFQVLNGKSRRLTFEGEKRNLVEYLIRVAPHLLISQVVNPANGVTLGDDD